MASYKILLEVTEADVKAAGQMIGVDDKRAEEYVTAAIKRLREIKKKITEEKHELAYA
jgi:hypothetical protein